jgi:hypothetical protein
LFLTLQILTKASLFEQDVKNVSITEHASFGQAALELRAMPQTNVFKNRSLRAVF